MANSVLDLGRHHRQAEILKLTTLLRQDPNVLNVETDIIVHPTMVPNARASFCSVKKKVTLWVMWHI